MKCIIFYFVILSIGFSITAENPNHFVFTEKIESKTLIDKSLYAQCVENLPICCVDIFLYNTKYNVYLLIKRIVPPAQGLLYFPGGRLFKGESFFDCARRKCKEEVGIEVTPLAIIDVYSTIFPDSAWNCQTHTINIAVLAICEVDDIELSLSEEHDGYTWHPITQAPENIYLHDIYKKTIAFIMSTI